MKEQKTVAVSFRVSPRFKRSLAAAAARERRSQTNLLEYLLFTYCNANGLSTEAKLVGQLKRTPLKREKQR